MTTMSTDAEKLRVRRMLRTLKAGDRVHATIRASLHAREHQFGTVLDPNPFQPDGVRRVRVQWDEGLAAHVLPSSIEPEGT